MPSFPNSESLAIVNMAILFNHVVFGKRERERQGEREKDKERERNRQREKKDQE